MKRLKLLSVLVLILFGLGQAATGQDPDCYDNYSEDNFFSCSDWGEEIIDTIRISIPFDSCNIYVRYLTRDCTRDSVPCPGRKSRQIRLLGFDWDCDTLSGWLFPGYSEGDYSEIDAPRYMDILDEIESVISMEEFLKFYDEVPEYAKFLFQCSLPGCDVPDPEDTIQCNRFEIFFTNPKCAAICVNEDPASMSMRSSIIPCVEEELTCCMHIRYFCACVVGGVLIGTKVYDETSEIEGDCDEAEPKGTCPIPPPGWILHQYPCSNRCPTP